MTAMRAQEADAFDYLPKPFDLEKLIEQAEDDMFADFKKVRKPLREAVIEM